MSEGYVSFFKAPVYYFRQAFDWKGRTSRSGYWWVLVWELIVGVVLMGLAAKKIINPNILGMSLIEGIKTGHYIVIIGALIQLLLIVPETTWFARRSRDAAVSVNWAYVIAILGFINVFVPDAVIQAIPVVGPIYSVASVLFGLYILYIGIRPSQVLASDGKSSTNK